eukprot:scaffold1621_cov111-Isochrysis_galbana.AAC.5
MSIAFPHPRLSSIAAQFVSFNPQLPNPQIFPARSIAAASAQFQVRDPTVEREGPVTPLYGARLDVETGGVSVETGDVSVEFPIKCKHFLKRQIADQNRSNISDDGRFHAIDAKSQTNFDLDLA